MTVCTHADVTDMSITTAGFMPTATDMRYMSMRKQTRQMVTHIAMRLQGLSREHTDGKGC